MSIEIDVVQTYAWIMEWMAQSSDLFANSPSPVSPSPFKRGPGPDRQTDYRPTNTIHAPIHASSYS